MYTVSTLEVFAEPDFDADVVGILQLHGVITVNMGVECNDNATWWNTDAGYVVESIGKQYNLVSLRSHRE